MWRDGLASRFIKDTSGASFLEFTLVLPLFLVITFGIVDASLLMFSWADAQRITQFGARLAATSNPAAANIDVAVEGLTASVATGTPCINGSGVVSCKVGKQYSCIATDATTGGTCTAPDGTTTSFDNTNFSFIFDQIKFKMYSKDLDRRQIRITYIPLNSGFVGRPKTPMNVVVSIRCMKQPLIIGGLVGLNFPSGWGSENCGGLTDPGGWPLKASTTLPSEDLATN